MKRFFSSFFNPDIQLRSRLFQLLSLIAFLEFVIVTVYTTVTGGDIGHILLMLAGTILFAGVALLTIKTGKLRIGSTITGLLYFTLYPLTFFSSGGIYGGAPAVFAFALIYVFLVTEKWERVVSLTLCVGATGVCFLLAYLRPELLDRHNVSMEHAESFLSVLLVVVLICALFAFVTEVYRAENRIVQQQKKEIEELNQTQKRFFSNMSHEIRTPVNAIIGFNEMTLREDVSDEVRENAANIESASRILLHTINEILDLAQLESGRMEIITEDYHTSALLTEVSNMVRPRALEKGLEFRVEADPRLPSELHGDEMRIRQIVLNVLSNAVKYTKTGSVTFQAGGTAAAGKDGSFVLCFDVIDTGIGIREENIPNLFTAFQRLDARETHVIEGTGLGLSIVKQLLDMMGGTVSVRSEYGKGSTFHIEVPQTVVNDAPIGELPLRRIDRTEQSGRQTVLKAPSVRILTVDDTPMNLLVVKRLLRETEAQIDTAESGEEALEKTKQIAYDLILMDHQMPVMDGIECLHAIRAQEGGLCRTAKIVCLTANAGSEMERQYRDAGFDGYLVKPVRGKTLEDELTRLLPGRYRYMEDEADV